MLSEALYQLLHNAAYRSAFLRDDHAGLGLEAMDVAALQTIDREELVKTSEQVLTNVLKGDFDVEGGLRKSYPGVFQCLRDMGYTERGIMYEFLASDAFREYREIPFAGTGICVEESFFLFLRDHDGFLRAAPTNELLLRHEFLTVMLSILTVNGDPHFTIHSTDLVHHNGQIRYAVQTYPRPIVEALLGRPVAGADRDGIRYIYAASLRDTFVKGPVEDLALALIRRGPACWDPVEIPEILALSSLDPEEFDKLRARLTELGLLARA